MKIYFVSGFLGSGKTTSIINAGKILMARGLNVGVITNDQGKYLVDNSFVNASGIPSIEVANGCFCCNYDDFDSHVIELAENQKPDIIFAESVGSCADIIATVMKPILEFRKNHAITSVLTTFTDSRLLRARLSGGNLPFSDDVIYIFDKQIEEADILVINKSDLISDSEGRKLLDDASKIYPDKKILLQTAFSDLNLKNWMSSLEDFTPFNRNSPSMKMDYNKYADGELKMAWFDKVFKIESSADLGIPIQFLFESIIQALELKGKATGHLKLFIQPSACEAVKLSHTGMDGNANKQKLPLKIGTQAEIILNARVETDPKGLRNIINQAIKKTGSKYSIDIETLDENSFRPGIPRPVHRFD